MRRVAGIFAASVLALVVVVAPIAMAAGLGGGGLSAPAGGGSVNGTAISPTSVTLSTDNGVQFNDHSGPGSYWTLQQLSSSLGNIDALALFRTGGSNPYWWWDKSSGLAVARFGVAVPDGSGTNGSGNQRLVPIVHGAATTQQAIECKDAAMTAGSLAVTFAETFSAAPVCTCTHVDTTNANTCTIHVAPTVSAVTFAVASGATDHVQYCCMGNR